MKRSLRSARSWCALSSPLRCIGTIPVAIPSFYLLFYRGLHRLLAHHAPLELSVSADALLFHDQRVFEDDTGEISPVLSLLQ